MRNRLISINEKNVDYLSFEYYNQKGQKDFSPDKKSMLRFIKTASEITLTDKQKMYFDEFFINGKSVNQIAEETGRHKSTVSREITRAKEKIKKYSDLYF